MNLLHENVNYDETSQDRLYPRFQTDFCLYVNNPTV